MNFPPEIPVIETPRLRLRPFAAADAPDVQRLAGAREVADTTARLPHPYPDGAAEAWIATHAAAWTERRELALAITLREGGGLLGSIGLVLNPAHEQAELGYWIGVPHWRRGYATEAASALADYAFRVLGLQRVQAHHFARNPASGRVLLKSGLRREGTSPRAFLCHGRFEDLVFYGAVRRDWPGLG
jgi:[ribosomal protein S5]-alanine N-acetyltransferase